MGKTILVADDSDTIRRAVEMTFHATEFSVVAARSGDEALAQLERVRPDVVLADCVMDGVDGYAVCARIKDAGHAVPVVLMASAYQPVDRQKAEMARATTSLSKPFDTKTLLNIVRQLTGVEVAADAPMTFADALARRNQPEPEPAPAPIQVEPAPDAAYAVGSADIIIEDEPEIIGEVDAPAMMAGPTLEPPAPPDGMAPRPPVDMWALTEDTNSAQQSGVAEVLIEEEPVASEHEAPTADFRNADGYGNASDGYGNAAGSFAPSTDGYAPPVDGYAPGDGFPQPEPEGVTSTLGSTANDVQGAPSAAAIAGLPPEEIREMVRAAVEKVVWEVVPELAETIIREELARLTKPSSD